MKPRLATIGCRAHSGWAAIVVIAGTSEAPEVIFRRRIEICDAAIRGSKQPYHSAEPLPFPDAKAHLKCCSDSTQRLSREAFQTLGADLTSKGYELKGFGMILGSGRPLPELKAILASHALIHTAEGEFYRRALIEAGEHCGLPVTGVRERELFEQASARLRQPVDQIQQRIAELGKTIGPPWTQDQKYAALVGWLAIPVTGSRG
jgi:hypothetical protein